MRLEQRGGRPRAATPAGPPRASLYIYLQPQHLFTASIYSIYIYLQPLIYIYSLYIYLQPLHLFTVSKYIYSLDLYLQPLHIFIASTYFTYYRLEKTVYKVLYIRLYVQPRVKEGLNNSTIDCFSF